MISWLKNPHTDYVITAYAIAFTALLVFALLSWFFSYSQNKKLLRLKKNRKENSL